MDVRSVQTRCQSVQHSACRKSRKVNLLTQQRCVYVYDTKRTWNGFGRAADLAPDFKGPTKRPTRNTTSLLKIVVIHLVEMWYRMKGPRLSGTGIGSQRFDTRENGRMVDTRLLSSAGLGRLGIVGGGQKRDACPVAGGWKSWQRRAPLLGLGRSVGCSWLVEGPGGLTGVVRRQSALWFLLLPQSLKRITVTTMNIGP